MIEFLKELSKLKGLEELSITTNGVATAPHIPEMKRIGIRSVNLSLDTLDRQRFLDITHRDELDKVLHTLDLLLEHEMEVKVNAVVMDGKNIDDIIPLVAMTKEKAVSVRFIEEMPFNGTDNSVAPLWDHMRILEKIRDEYPGIHKVPDAPHSTSYNYHIPGHKGTVGIIAAYTRSFCGSCNRIRVTPDGTLKTCLYDGGGMNVRDLMRTDMNDEELTKYLLRAIDKKPFDGWEAEQGRDAISESMAMIGG
jgi:cyclic pyranopterin phosphate synthase